MRKQQRIQALTAGGVSALSLAVLLGALGGCESTSGAAIAPTCGGEVSCTLNDAAAQRTAQKPINKGSTALVFGGTCSHSGGLAITDLSLGGAPIKPSAQAFNFSKWTTELKYEDLLILADATGSVSLRLVARDSCGAQFVVGETKLTVDLTPGSVVKALKLELMPPSQLPKGAKTYLPMNGKPALLKIASDDKDAAGATVKLSSEGVRFWDGLSPDGSKDTSVTLAEVDGDALATVLVIGHQPGLAQILAESEGVAALVAVNVAGPPELKVVAGSGGTKAELSPDESLTLRASSGGAIAACWATPSQAFSVTGLNGDGNDLMAGVVKTAGGDATSVDVVVALSLQLTETEVETTPKVVVTCRDHYGQANSKTISGSTDDSGGFGDDD